MNLNTACLLTIILFTISLGICLKGWNIGLAGERLQFNPQHNMHLHSCHKGPGNLQHHLLQH